LQYKPQLLPGSGCLDIYTSSYLGLVLVDKIDTPGRPTILILATKSFDVHALPRFAVEETP
jgi:hypothetical protein